jgi:hypothetical protein
MRYNVLIEPIQPINLNIKVGEEDYLGYMLSLTDETLELSCNEYLDKETMVEFISNYFKGRAIIKDIKFAKTFFIYKLEIIQINFQPGLLVNMRL